MANLNSKIILTIIIVLVFAAGGMLFYLTRAPEVVEAPVEYAREQISVEPDLTPIDLTPEEQQALQEEGLQMPYEKDPAAEALRNVRSSDELGAIEADLNETDLSSLDAELDTIENDLRGL